MTHLPVACTLSHDELHCCADELLPGLAKVASSIRRGADDVTLTFVPAPDLLARIASVIERERHCCQFLTFALAIPAGGAAFELAIGGPAGTGMFLESLTPVFAASAST